MAKSEELVSRFGLRYHQVTFDSDGLCTAVHNAGRSLLGAYFSSGLSTGATKFGIQGSFDKTTWFNVYDSDADLILNITKGTYVPIDPTFTCGLEYVRLRLGTSTGAVAQSSDGVSGNYLSFLPF